MRTITIVTVLVLIGLAASCAMAGDVEVKAQKIQTQGMVGTLGAAGGIFWPVIDVPEFDIKLGPMGAIGTNTAVGGGGIQIPVKLSAPILEELNFGWAGYGYNWEDHEWGWEGGVGLTITVK